MHCDHCGHYQPYGCVRCPGCGYRHLYGMPTGIAIETVCHPQSAPGMMRTLRQIMGLPEANRGLDSAGQS